MPNPVRITIDIGESYVDPYNFVECVALAEKCGINYAWLGDHFLPWTHSRKRSGFVWSYLPVALDRTKEIKVGPSVTIPIGGRYHPAIIAQAAATIDNMYPGRFLLGVGSGEAMSESRFMSNGKWPPWRERIDRLVEGITLMRKLWESEEYFSFSGKYFSMKDVFLYTKPKSKIEIYFSALGPKGAAYAGQYADHLVTIASPQKCREEIFPAFEAAAVKAGKDPNKMEKVANISSWFADSKQSGVEEVRRLGDAGLFDRGSLDEIDPRKIEQRGTRVSDEQILQSKVFVTSPEVLIEEIEQYQKVGATSVTIVTQSKPENIRFVGEKVLPYFREDSH
jgi:coenzyme F420-dependent glucose-6-phosphate dehydrogenase